MYPKPEMRRRERCCRRQADRTLRHGSGLPLHPRRTRREVFITDASTQTIRIEASEKLMPYVIVEEQNGTLQITIDKG